MREIVIPIYFLFKGTFSMAAMLFLINFADSLLICTNDDSVFKSKAELSSVLAWCSKEDNSDTPIGSCFNYSM